LVAANEIYRYSLPHLEYEELEPKKANQKYWNPLDQRERMDEISFAQSSFYFASIQIAPSARRQVRICFEARARSSDSFAIV
jgi:hypothetical protein